ncbi:butyrophilin subfamily 2 member A2-like [Acipenser ruthenus]|uniref:butyrophilin subfamily 2 member A2-like n=1 Tax=Acipenser ruthenus TaxID=7906 RepID=UPI002741F264|nr:butyrophilin subfamily 2 member A2-like [Acipenser ruthenus]
MKMRSLGRTCLIVLSLLPAVSTQDGSSVVGSDQTLIASAGEDVILPCHITPSVSAVDLDVRWYRDSFDILVHLYEDRRDRTDVQDSDYRGRTALSRFELEDGILSLNLRNLRPSDSGVYSCYATDGVWDGQGKTELIVRALGTQPSISMDSTQGEQTRLVCRSEGWSPEPEVIWRDRDGNDVTSLSNTTLLRVSQGLRSVSSYIKIKQQSNVFSCLVRSKIPKPDWESKLHISRDFFPGVSGWMVAFFLTLALSIGAIPLLVIQWRRMDAMERKLEPMAAQRLRDFHYTRKGHIVKNCPEKGGNAGEENEGEQGEREEAGQPEARGAESGSVVSETLAKEGSKVQDTMKARGSLNRDSNAEESVSESAGVEKPGSGLLNTEVDAPTQFFFGMEKKSAQRKVIHCLKTLSGDELREPREIQQCAVDIYTKLFTAEAEGQPEETQHFLETAEDL